MPSFASYILQRIWEVNEVRGFDVVDDQMFQMLK